MNSHWLRAEREMSQIGRGSLNFKLAIGEMNFSTQATTVDFLLSNKFPRFVPFFISAITVCYQKNEDSGPVLDNNKTEEPRLLCSHFSLNCISFIEEITNKSTVCALKPT